MTLEDLVPDLELCQRWKKAGGRQDTVFAWVDTINGPRIASKQGNFYMFLNGPGWVVEERSVICAAPSASELMEWLKEKYENRILTAMQIMALVLNWVSGYDIRKLPNALLLMALGLEGKK